MAGKAGSQVEDKKQEYQYSVPWITPSGHEISFYDTPENQRLVMKHTSGSHIEFKTDGSVFLKAVKDMHIHGSVLSEASTGAGGAAGAEGSDASTLRYDADFNIEVGGTLRIKATKLEVDVGETSKWISGTDCIITANNIEEKANENISLEGTKSIYVDTKEYRERSVSHRTEEGTMETGGGVGGSGVNYMNVQGNFIINNTDPTGGITLMSAGYMNLVCGQERVDIVGKYVPKPSALGVGTFTQQVFTPTPAMPQNKSIMPGDYTFQSMGGASYIYSLGVPGSSVQPAAGLNQVVALGNHLQTVTVGLQNLTVVAGHRNRIVGAGNETVTIGGIQKVTAAMIFLN